MAGLTSLLPEFDILLKIGVFVALVLSFVGVWWLDRPSGRWSAKLRSRFVFGVPWGTLVAIVGVLLVYLFVQGGLHHWRNPVTLAFSSWSLLYPTGVLTAPFSHAGPGHLLGNLMGTVVLAPLAEYYWGHFPKNQGKQSFSSWKENPFVRAFVLFPLAVIVIALLTSAFSWGPIIGFSGVVFAFAGFALVRYPLATVIALTGQEVVSTVYRALRDPVVVASSSPSFSRPWWSQIAIQGHTLGLFLGVFAGVVLLSYRDERPSALRSWTGALLATVSLSLWAVYWFRGEDTYVLYRGLGVVFVLTVAMLVAVGVRATDRPLLGDLTRRQAATLALAAPLLIMAFVAVPVNLTTVADAGVPGDGPSVTAGGYNVTYAEDVQNQMVYAFDASAFGESTQVNTSGVIVVNEDREIWVRDVSKSRLAFNGRAAVDVGGLGWRETVHVKREGWSAVGNGTAYQVWLHGAGEDWRHAYASDPVTAGPVVAGRNVTVVPRDGKFLLRVTRNETTLTTVEMPSTNETVTAGGIQFRRDASKIVATVNETRVTVAKQETYR